MKGLKGMILIITFLLSFVSVIGQQSFNINKSGKIKRIKYFKGQEIQLKVNDNRIKGTITALTDSSLTISDVIVPISTINYVIHPRIAFIWGFIRKIGFRASIGYLLLDGGTRVSNNSTPIIDDHLLKVTTPLLSAGAIGSIFKNRRFKNKGHNMRVNDISMP